MNKKLLCLLLATVLCFALSACGNEKSAAEESSEAPAQEETAKSDEAAPAEDTADTGADSAAQEEAARDNTESSEEKYTWDTNGDMPMNWETNDDYLQYVEIADEACPIGEIDEKPFVSMKSIFPSWSGWPMDGFMGTKIIPWHFEASAELGEEAKEYDEYFTIWGGLSYLKDSDESAESVIKSSLSYYLSGNRAEDANEGTLATTGLRTKEINGHTVMYVRMQFEYDHHVFSLDKDVTMYMQRTEAIIPVETSEEGFVFFDVMIDELRKEPNTFSDDSIIDKIFENVIYGE